MKNRGRFWPKWNYCYICSLINTYKAMKTPLLKRMAMLAALMLVAFCAHAQQNYKGLFTDKPKKLLIEAQVGRSFLGAREGADAGEVRVFYGGAALSYGVQFRHTFWGLGASAEYVDLMEGSFDFPVFLNGQFTFSKESDRGFFAGVKLGYILGGKKNIPIQTMVDGEVIEGSDERSMKGFYGEVSAGYCFSSFNLFVAYNYRVIGYERIWLPNQFGLSNSSSSRNMHTVMLGIAFRLF